MLKASLAAPLPSTRSRMLRLLRRARSANGASSWEILRHCQRLEWSRGSQGRCCEGAGRLRSTARVKRVLQLLPTRLADADAVSLNLIAKSVGLSPSRFLHLFTTSVGIPLRPYILWLRLQCAARELARGTSVTDAAHNAGFWTRRISRGHSAACWERRRVRSLAEDWLRGTSGCETPAEAPE